MVMRRGEEPRDRFGGGVRPDPEPEPTPERRRRERPGPEADPLTRTQRRVGRLAANRQRQPPAATRVEPTLPQGQAPAPGASDRQPAPGIGRDIDPEATGLQDPAPSFARVGGRESAQRGMLGAVLSRQGLFGKPGMHQFQGRGGALPGMIGRKTIGGGGGGGMAPSAGLSALGSGSYGDLAPSEDNQQAILQQLLSQQFGG